MSTRIVCIDAGILGDKDYEVLTCIAKSFGSHVTFGDNYDEKTRESRTEICGTPERIEEFKRILTGLNKNVFEEITRQVGDSHSESKT